MPFTNGTALKFSITSWLARDDDDELNDIVVSDVISMFEADMNRRLRVGEMASNVAFTFAGASRTATIDALELLTDPTITSCGPPKRLIKAAAAVIDSRYELTQSGTPDNYSILATDDTDLSVLLGPTPDQDYSGTVWAYASLISVAGGASSPLLTRYPDLYLFGSLSMAQNFIGDDARMPVWQARFEKILADANAAWRRQRYSGGAGEDRTRFGP